MVTRPSDCDPNRLRALLDDRLDDLDQSAMAAHLESCDDCRRTLDSLAAGSRLWSEARIFLGTPPTAELGHTTGWRRTEVEPGLLDFLAPSDDPAHLGRLGPYEVVEVIGRGGMGLVLRAIDPALNRHVAIKVLAPELATSATARRRFAREGQAAAAICHDHIVAIYGVDGSGPLPYLVMQLVTGKSLQERIDQTGPLAVEEILRIGMQTASGLAAAHAVGLIHRDVKPSNILLENCVERVKITDFGLARAVDDASLTQSGVVAGTPQYMSPEQARGEATDHRADLFSLGSVLYALCTGRPPFRADTTMAVLRRVSDDTPRPIRELNADIPAWLAAIVTKLHAKNPADRFDSATEVATLFERCIAYLREPTLMPPPFEVESPAKPRRRLAMAAGIIGLSLLGLGAAEATGVTKVVATVLRIKTAGGTLVVKVGDPKVKVRLDGKDLVITGAGLEEVRVNAGEHHVQGLKDGKVVSETIVSIARGGEETVNVSVEPEPVPATATTPGPKPESAEIALAEIDLKRASNRLDWSKTMFDKGYQSRARFDADHQAYLKAKVDADNARRKQKDDQHVKSTEVEKARADLALANAVDARTKTLAERGFANQRELTEAELVQKRAEIIVDQKMAAIGGGAAAIARENAELKRRIRDLEDAKRRLLETARDPGRVERLHAIEQGLLREIEEYQRLSRSPHNEDLSTPSIRTRILPVPTPSGREPTAHPGASPVPVPPILPPLPTPIEGAPAAISPVPPVPPSPHSRPIAPNKPVGANLFGTAVFKLVVAPDGKTFATGGDDGVVRIYDVASRQLVRELKETLNTVEFIPLKLDGRTVHRQEVTSIPPPVIFAIAYRPDGKTLVSGGEHRGSDGSLLNEITVWDVATAKVKARLDGHDSSVGSMAISPDGRHLVSSGGDALRVWDLDTNKQIKSLKIQNHVYAIAWNPDGKSFASVGRDGRVRLWDVEGRAIDSIECTDDKEGLYSIAFSPDGKSMLVGGGDDVTLLRWKKPGDRERKSFDFNGTVVSVAFSPDGKSIAAAGGKVEPDDRTLELRIWDVESGRETRTLDEPGQPIFCLAYIRDDKTLIAGGRGVDGSGFVTLWDLSEPSTATARPLAR